MLQRDAVRLITVRESGAIYLDGDIVTDSTQAVASSIHMPDSMELLLTTLRSSRTTSSDVKSLFSHLTQDHTPAVGC